jgi:uncharacterized protein (TIGR00369 family)
VENSPYNERLGARPEDLADGRVRLVLETDASHVNEVGVVHGGVAMSLLDGAMGRCCVRSLDPGSSCATVQISVQFLAPAKGRLSSLARITKRGRRVAFLEAECHRDDGTLIARAQGTWAIFERRG